MSDEIPQSAIDAAKAARGIPRTDVRIPSAATKALAAAMHAYAQQQVADAVRAETERCAGICKAAYECI